MDSSGWFAAMEKPRVYAGRPGESPKSVMVNHFGGNEIMDLIVELALQADAVIIGPGRPTLLTRTELREQLRPDTGLGEPVHIASGRELREAIAHGSLSTLPGKRTIR
jgi:hypothetical protein